MIEESNNHFPDSWCWAVLTSLLVILHSCGLNENPLRERDELHLTSRVDTAIIASETYHFSFGEFEPEERIAISYPPQYASFYEIASEGNERTLRYQAEEAFLGVDSLVVITRKVSREFDRTLEIEKITLIFNVVKHDFHRKIIGKWHLIELCGGWTGECWVPGDDHFQTIEFDHKQHFIKEVNGYHELDMRYTFADHYMREGVTYYDIQFENGGSSTYYRIDENLGELNGDTWREHQRLE